jgi:hypothetical protein
LREVAHGLLQEAALEELALGLAGKAPAEDGFRTPYPALVGSVSTFAGPAPRAETTCVRA